MTERADGPASASAMNGWVDQQVTFYKIVTGQQVPPESLDAMLTSRFAREELAAQVAANLREQLPPSDASPRVLDVAGGTGIITRSLKKEGMDPVTLDLGRENLVFLQEQDPSVPVVNADMNAPWPFADNSFEGITNVWAMRFARGNKFWENSYRTVKPGGVVVVPSFRSEELLKPFTGNPFQPVSPEPLAAQAERAGFTVSLTNRVDPVTEMSTLFLQGKTVPAAYVVARK